jgi:hypothetical protein
LNRRKRTAPLNPPSLHDRTPERRLRGHASFALPHTESFSAASNVANSSPIIPQDVADRRIQGSELADLDLEPSFVVPASVTVIHPQLRDLISCPKERGVIYHVKGPSIVELTVDVNDYPDESGDEERQDEGKRAGSRPSRNKETWCPSVSFRACLKTEPRVSFDDFEEGRLTLVYA